jgi:hypothetical protein
MRFPAAIQFNLDLEMLCLNQGAEHPRQSGNLRHLSPILLLQRVGNISAADMIAMNRELVL